MFVVYHIKSTMADKVYKREQDARKRLAKLNARPPAGTRAGDFAYSTHEVYERDVVYMVERTNIMSGKKFMEKSNTPHYLSPSSETYWST